MARNMATDVIIYCEPDTSGPPWRVRIVEGTRVCVLVAATRAEADAIKAKAMAGGQ